MPGSGRRIRHANEPGREAARQGQETSRFTGVCIGDQGQLVMEGQDVGKAPMEFRGDGDYEFRAAMPAEQEEGLRQALLRERWGSCLAGGEPGGTAAVGYFSSPKAHRHQTHQPRAGR